MKKPRSSWDRLIPRELRRAAAAARLEHFLDRAAAVHGRHVLGLKASEARKLTMEELADAFRRSLSMKSPRSRKPPKEGGEPIPAIPRPKPKPRLGGAAARLEFERRKPGPVGPRRARSTLPQNADETEVGGTGLRP